MAAARSTMSSKLGRSGRSAAAKMRAASKKTAQVCSSGTRPRDVAVPGALACGANLKDMARHYLKRLPNCDRQRLLDAASTAAKVGRPIRIGTMCSGVDTPVPVFRHLAKALSKPGAPVEVEHVFSCEFDKKKQRWIRRNFPKLKTIFDDVKVLGSGKAMNVITGKVEPVPAVDIVIAGFVCKSVSMEQNNRAEYAACIEDGTGLTGETFSGVKAYVEAYKPAIVICENVEGLAKTNRGMKPQIYEVMSQFKKAGYSADWALLNSKSFLLPHRRPRVWMWAFRGQGCGTQAASAKRTVEALKSDVHLSASKLFGPPQKNTHPLNKRHRSCVSEAKKNLKRAGRAHDHPDLFVDINKKAGRQFGLHTACCLVPNSIMYWERQKRVLTPKEHFAAQGIFPEDFPAMKEFLKESGTKGLCKDLAGNAFTSSVCLAVSTAALAHSPMFGGKKHRR